MDSIDKLTEIFKEFPGIGERQARRFVYFLMARNGSYVDNLTQLIAELKKDSRQCKSCFRYFIGKTCELCESGDAATLIVVEKDSDLESVKKSRVYGGKYFVLGGLVPIVEKDTKRKVRVEELKNRIKGDKNLKEVILAFSLSPQGDHTDQYLRGLLKDFDIKISSLGRGLSTGTELEYSDNDTLRNALKNRQ